MPGGSTCRPCEDLSELRFPKLPLEEGALGRPARGRAGRGAGWGEAEMGEGGGAGDPAAWRALQEAQLDQVRLGHVLDRVWLLADRHRQGGEPHRLAAVALAEHLEQRHVQLVEAERVDLEQLQRLPGDGGVDATAAAHLGEVAHPAQQPKRSRSGEVISPVRVVAATRVKRGRSSRRLRAPGPLPSTTSIWKSSIAG